MMAREDRLSGATWKASMPERPHVYITVNQDANGAPCEVFIRYDRADAYEWITAITVGITRQLQAGVSLREIAADLMEIHSPATSHFIPGGGGECSSLAARIGKVLMQHAEWTEKSVAA